EMKRIKNETVADSELQNIKNYVTGNFAISLENPQTIASFAINIDKYNLPRDYYKNYLKNVAAVTPAEIKLAADKYIKPDNSNIVVVGDADQVQKSLKQFGPITYYDVNGNKIDTSLAKIPGDLSAKDILDHYIKAIGGSDSLAAVRDRTTVMSGTIQGFEITTTIYQKAPDLFKQVVDAGQMQQQILFDGNEGIMQAGGQETKITGDELEKLKYQASMNSLLKLDSLGIQLRLGGMEKVNNKDVYKIEMIFPSGNKWGEYFDPETGLKVKETKDVKTAQGNFTQENLYSDYRDVDGVKYPFMIKQSLGPQNMEFRVVSIKINSDIPDSTFKLK
ncbi:MAG TPA: hypothetical protein VLB50_10420, partial [Ignavibacteriaceae bacterium]|nr:hypothetical protein [Ignavibacteriaceae bacterium]